MDVTKMVKDWFGGTVDPSVGKIIKVDTMLLLGGIKPAGAGLHEPPGTCLPLVRGNCANVSRQKLIKLFEEVSEAA